MPYALTRLTNYLRCLGSYALSFAGISHVSHMPTFVSVEPANFCQLSCPECPVGLRRGKPVSENGSAVMSISDFQRILAQLAPYAHTILLFWQGEPLLCNDLPQMIRMAHQAGLYTIVSTNAQRMDAMMAQALVDAGMNKIIVSMDGWTQVTYEQYRRGGSVEKVKQAVRFLRQAKQHSRAHMVIELQCLCLHSNEQEWTLLRHEYRQLGADRLTLKTAQLYDYQHGSPLMPSNPRYARYRWDERTHTYIPKRPLHNRCFRLWSGCVIDVKGNVLPCCYDKLQQHPFGNLLTTGESLHTIWHNKRAEDFRRAVITNRAAIPVCTNCSE